MTLLRWIVIGVALGMTPVVCLGRTLSLGERLEAQRAVETVYWSHRTWPADNAEPKPPLAAVMPDEVLRARVEMTLAESRLLALRGGPITKADLQAELDRIAASTHDGKVLAELFEALDNDPELIAETLVRQLLAERRIRDAYENDMKSDPAHSRGTARKSVEVDAQPESHPKASFEEWLAAQRAALLGAESTGPSTAGSLTDPGSTFTLPLVPATACTPDTWSPTRSVVPDPRAGQSAVWTGTEMIVWGGGAGLSGNVAQATGGRYNPATDTWTATSTGTGAPTARTGHTAVWTGSVMIVWGGSESGGATNTGARYDPATDTWTATSAGVNVPSARYRHTALWTGTEMIVWGGGTNVWANTGGRYNPTTDTWTATSTGTNTPAARYNHIAVWTGTQMIVWGGFDDTNVMNSGGRYTPSSNSWATTSTGTNTPAARRGMTGVWTGTQLVIWGGLTTSGTVNTGGRYTPSSNSWTTTSTGANVPSARFQHAAVYTGSVMVVWGASNDGSGGRYDPGANTWLTTSTGAGVPADRTGPSMVWTGTEVIIWGGGVGPPVNTGARYTPGTNSWVPTSLGAPIPTARSGHAAVWTGAEMIVWGGGTAATGGRYYPATDSWFATSTGANSPSARAISTGVWTGKEMIVWGGASGGVYLNTGARYDPGTDSWRATSTGTNVPSGRYNHMAVWTGKEMIVWGGFGGASTNTGGRYDPRSDTWTPTSVGAGVPAARNGARAVWTGTEMIVWGGGLVPGAAGTGGRYDPTSDTWTPTSTTSAPEDRYAHAAVWTGSRMMIWGGKGGQFSIPLATGGLYDPSNDSWTATPPGVNLLALAGSTAVWTGADVIIWGGEWTTPENIGHRFNVSSNSWAETSTGAKVPQEREAHTAVWTGTNMIVWGGDPTTSSGALYCACPNGTLVFRDVDGDGYGQAGGAMGSCDGSVPAGYVTNQDDCDDRKGSVHPGATENCNALDDDCDGSVDESVAVPSGVPALTETKSGASAVLAWPADPGATGYDVVKGTLPALLASGGNFTTSTTACLANDLTGTTVSDSAVLSAGGALWYLVRPVNACSGHGTYDEGSASQQGSRDAEIQGAGAACP